MKSVLFISLILSLVVGFIIGAVLGVQVVEVYVDKIPRDTMYTFIVNNIGLLGSLSSFLALVFAILLFIGWRKQQKNILVIEHHKKLLESIAKLGSTFRMHILLGSFKKEETTVFFDELNGQIINISQLITVHYILTDVKRNGRTYIDCTLNQLDDFLDPVKGYYLFISNYCALSNCASTHFDNENNRMGYLSLDNDIAKYIFKDAKEESGFKYINIGTYNMRVSRKFDLAVDAIKSEIG